MSKRTPSKPVYAVRAGKTCGLFTDIDQLHKSVMDYRAAEFSKFDTLQEADAYLYKYCQMYDCSPPLAKDIVIAQVVSQRVEIAGESKLLCAAACYNNPFVATSDVNTPEQLQVITAIEILKKLEPRPDQALLLGGMCVSSNGAKVELLNYVVEAVAKFDKITAEEKVESLLDLKDRPTLLQYVAEKTFEPLCELIELNNQRNPKCKIVSSDDLINLYMVRVPVFAAGNLLGMLANDLKRAAERDVM